MGALSPMHWLIIVGVLVVLFGAKRLPEAARSLGRSARILKAEVHGMNEPAPADAQTSALPAPGRGQVGDPAPAVRPTEAL